MGAHLVPKQPSESFYVGIDFSSVPLADGETVVLSGNVNGQQKQSSVSAYNSTGTSVNSIIVDDTLAVQDDTILKAKVQGGSVPDRRYKISFGAVTSHGNFYESDLILDMED